MCGLRTLASTAEKLQSRTGTSVDGLTGCGSSNCDKNVEVIWSLLRPVSCLIKIVFRRETWDRCILFTRIQVPFIPREVRME